MNNMIRRIGNLITIKSIVTLVLTVVFALLALRGTVSDEVFISVYSTIIGFYFGVQKVDDTSKDANTDKVAESTKTELYGIE